MQINCSVCKYGHTKRFDQQLWHFVGTIIWDVPLLYVLIEWLNCNWVRALTVLGT